MPATDLPRPVLLASRSFSVEDQAWFASFSGDRNPMHMDPLTARRTQAGAPVVYGIHLLLWSLDALARLHPELPSPRMLTVRFDKFSYVGDPVEIWLTGLPRGRARLEVRIAGTRVCLIQVGFEPSVVTVASFPEDGAITAIPPVAQDLTLEEMREACGRLGIAAGDEAGMDRFPELARWLGPFRIAALAATSALVGMVCPGLHSIYAKLKLDFIPLAVEEQALAYQVTSVDERFRLLQVACSGSGIAGKIECFARLPPQLQAGMASLSGTGAGNAYAGSIVLIVGGSRGLGELTAKLVAAGGGKVIITYRVGATDAEAVATEINAGGGSCTVIPFDATRPAGPQLNGLAEAPTHAYYFATPAIFRRPGAFFEPERLASFTDIYVRGFWSVCEALRALRPDVAIFYPSSVAVVDRPRGMLEYAMAKLAGEALCRDINASLAPTRVVVERLPRLPTDQTATVIPAKAGDPIKIMQRLVRLTQGSCLGSVGEPADA